MKSTFSIIAEKTCELLKIKPVLLHSVSNDTVLGIWFDPLVSCNNSYICSFVYPDSEEKAQIHIADEAEASKLAEESSASGLSILILPEATRRDEIVSSVYRAFAFYEEWYNNLLQIIRNGGDWFELLDEGHRVLQNPTILYDRSMRVLAYTRTDGTEDEIWADTTSSGTARVGTASEADELWKYVSKLDEFTEPFRHSGEGMSNPFYNSNIMLQGMRCGMVTVVEYRHALSLGDIDLLKQFSDLLSLKFRENGAQLSSEAESGQFVQDLLAGAIESNERLNTRIIAVQWNHARYFHLLIFYSPLSFITDGQWRQYYEDLSRCDLNGIGCILHRDRKAICYLLSTQREELVPPVKKMLESYCSSHRLRCGISNAYEDLLDTSHFLSQAIASLRLKPDLMVAYEEVRFLHLVDQLKAAEHPEDLMHPAVLKLMEIDRESGTDYLPTLASFVENGLNQTDTAKCLDIHRTTLIYRLKRIAEYTNLDLTDSESLIHVAISLEMLKE
jgi:hypothetical protein